ncbi:hypothetical protein [Flavobacterium wongokense]|uniref:hypothetical protein n=1 Tax=Flavobacterium wongokense TaxID=2910674 RepID=UPI001F3307D3|nr:hypothetical protein [Flavobacterium sp. WG47]MCF6130707.1 hypothetical protein [Flavobacterium sp. WG47]
MKNKYLLAVLILFLSVQTYSQKKADKYENLKSIKIDTLSNEGSISVVKMDLTPVQLGLEKSVKLDKIIFKVFYIEDGIIGYKAMTHKPENNEIAFFYAKNTQKMYFSVGSGLKETYLKKEFSQLIKIVEILEHRVFAAIPFSGMSAYSVLEEYK